MCRWCVAVQVAAMPIKQGVGIGGAMAVWAKACALVHILSDGTVIVNHGGVEMGQGLNIKIAQVRPRHDTTRTRHAHDTTHGLHPFGQLAAETLGVPLETVHVPPTSNEVLQHGGATGGSFTFELNGSAVRKARKPL
jgi:xanthine dehydrogenase molybdopterin-binding subunit B